MLLRRLLFLACVMSALSCQLNANKTACEGPYLACVPICALYSSQSACKAIPECTWRVGQGFYGSPDGGCWNTSFSPCDQFNTTDECEANPTCGWLEEPCNMGMYCFGSQNRTPGDALCPVYDRYRNCTNNPGCSLTPGCSYNHPCKLLFDQDGCLAREGCYWSESTFLGNRSSIGCAPCFTDFTNTENTFLAMQARVGRTCSITDNASATIAVHKAISSATGCSGGEPSFRIAAFSVCDPPLGVESNSPTNGLSASFVMISSIVMLLLAR